MLLLVCHALRPPRTPSRRFLTVLSPTAIATVTPPTDDIDIDRFMQWAALAGVQFPKLVVHRCANTGLRGLRATVAVADDETFLRVPLSLCLDDNGPPFDAWQTRLALRLMEERRRNSPYASFLTGASTAAELATSLPVHWSDELLELAGEVSVDVEREVRHMRAWREHQWELLQQQAATMCYGRAEFNWALDVVQTRNCRAACGRHLLVPVFDLMNHCSSVNSAFDVVVEDGGMEGGGSQWLCVRYQGHGVAAGGSVELNYRIVGDDSGDGDDGQAPAALTGADYMLVSYGFVAPADGSGSVDLFLPRTVVNKALVADLAAGAAGPPPSSSSRWSLVARAARIHGVRLGGPFTVFSDGVSGSLMQALRMLAFAAEEEDGVDDDDADTHEEQLMSMALSNRRDASAMTALLGALEAEGARLVDAAARIEHRRHQAGVDGDSVTQQRLDSLSSLVGYKRSVLDGCRGWATTYQHHHQRVSGALGAVFFCRVVTSNAGGGRRSMATTAAAVAAAARPPQQTLVGSFEQTLVVSKSKFIAKASHVPDLDAALAYVKRVSEPGASHNCWAYRGQQGTYERFSDDGEPGGTAGRPILTALEAEHMTDVAVVVTRYFGGTKLGTGGLVRAYGAAARECLRAAETKAVVPSTTLTIAVPVAASGSVYHTVERCAPTARRLSADMTPDGGARLTFEVPTAVAAEVCSRVADACKGQASFYSH